MSSSIHLRTPLLAWVYAGLFCGTLLPVPAKSEPASYHWVQMVPGGGAEARLVTAAPSCPPASVNGHVVAMTVRAEPSPPDYPVRLCVLALPPGTTEATLVDRPLPLPPVSPERILVVGDTGCRIHKRQVQACNDPAAWPWARIAATAAALRPDLVLHVGDYYYREDPCPEGNKGCAGSPYGDNWATWEAEYFAPARPLLETAPMVLVRGNHEDCKRGGAGWTRLLDPYPYSKDQPCRAASEPFGVSFDNLSLAVMDVADAGELVTMSRDVQRYAADFRTVAELARATDLPTWILMHRPIRGIAWMKTAAGLSLSIGGNNTLEKASAQGGLPPQVKAILSGHIHAFEALNFSGDPVQLVVGHGGDALDEGLPVKLDGEVVNDRKVDSGVSVDDFGFLLLTRNGNDWHGRVLGPSGTPRLTCDLRERSIACHPPAGEIRP
ncbi:MAG: metallophosphoesterase family protein [Alphaproteobacteria bacterium]